MLICSSVQSVPSMKHVIQISYFLKNQTIQTLQFCIFSKSQFFSFYTRALIENNLISWAYLQFIINLQNSGILHTSSMIKVILDPEHVAIPSKIVPFVHINPISLVCHNLLKSNIRHLNILRHSPTPLARCTLAALSLRKQFTQNTEWFPCYASRFTLNVSSKKVASFFGVVVCFRVSSI